MTSIRVEVAAEDIAEVGPVGDDHVGAWAKPLEIALERLTGQQVDVDGGDDEGHCIATIGQGDWSLVVDLPDTANEWLNARWGQRIDSGPIAFDLEIPTWVVDLVRDERPLLTLREAAPVLGVEPATLRQQAQAEWNGREGPAPRARRLGVVKLGRDWFVDRVAVEREATR